MRHLDSTVQRQNGSKHPVHSILLGSVGGDSHSVGLLILKQHWRQGDGASYF